METREAGDLAEGFGQDFGAKARSSHAEQEYVGKVIFADFVGQALELFFVFDLLFGDVQPAQPLALVGVCPQGGVALPQAADFSGGAPVTDGLRYFFGQGIGQFVPLLADLGRCAALRTLFDRSQQFVESFYKEADAVVGQLVGDGVNRDSHFGEILHHLLGFINAFGQSFARLAVIAERVKRRGRNSVDGIGANHFLHIKNVGVCWILGAGARPKHALALSTSGVKFVPLRAGKDIQVTLIREFSIGNGNLAQQVFELLFVLRVLRGLQARGDFRVHGVIDSADKEAGNAGHAAYLSAASGKFFQATNVSFRDALIDHLREQESDVDVDAFADQLLERRNALGRAWNFDHDVRTVHGLPEAACLFNRALGVASEIWRNLQADVAISLV